MSVFLVKVLWYRLKDKRTEVIGDNVYSSPINITDIIISDLNRGMEIRNNVLTLTLKNPYIKYYGTKRVSKYVSETTNKILFEEQDMIKFYATYSDDASEIEQSYWQDNTELPPEEYLIGTYYVIEHNSKSVYKRNNIKIICADKTFILFNKLLAYSFQPNSGWTAPKAIQKVIRLTSENNISGQFTGTNDDANVRYDIDAKLESEGGYIQDTRRDTCEDGTTNSDLDFPEISLAKVWKPVYEWVKELSQIEYINSADELTNTNGKHLVYGRSFLYWVDENNVFHWKECDDDVDYNLIIGETADVNSYNMQKKVFDSVNLIVFRGGTDLYNSGILNYYYDSTSSVKEVKMKVIPMTDIARTVKQKEISAGNLFEDSSGEFTIDGKKYKANFPVTTTFDGNSYSTASEYNTALRKYIERQCMARAKALVAGLSDARYKGSVEMKGGNYVVGSLYKVTNISTGQNEETLRIVGVKHNFTKDGWFTTLDLAQDQKAIIEGYMT